MRGGPTHFNFINVFGSSVGGLPQQLLQLQQQMMDEDEFEEQGGDATAMQGEPSRLRHFLANPDQLNNR